MRTACAAALWEAVANVGGRGGRAKLAKRYATKHKERPGGGGKGGLVPSACIRTRLMPNMEVRLNRGIPIQIFKGLEL